ncbi:MAG: Mur ligase family protein, partial [Phycisphaeraceae bacterium]
MRLLVQRLPNRLRTIGVTGSAGKSTVTAMIGHVLGKVFSVAPKGAGSDASSTPSHQAAKSPSKTQKVWVGGNIGGSLLPRLDEIGEDDWVVLELSSFMLERLKKDTHFPGWSPHIAVVTNISPNHLDWHGTMEEYVRSKTVLIRYQEDHDFTVSICDPSSLLNFGAKAGSQFYSDDPNLSPVGLTLLPGRHNQRNAWLASIAIHCVGLIDSRVSEYCDSEKSKVKYLADFSGLPHRLQLVAEHNGVRYFNDSKCTTPEAARLAIEAFTENDDLPGIHLILGGKDKGSDMTPLAG